MCMYLLYSNVYSNRFMTYCLMYEAWLSSSAHFNEAQCIFTGQFYLTHVGTQRKVEIFFPNILVFIFYCCFQLQKQFYDHENKKSKLLSWQKACKAWYHILTLIYALKPQKRKMGTRVSIVCSTVDFLFLCASLHFDE